MGGQSRPRSGAQRPQAGHAIAMGKTETACHSLEGGYEFGSEESDKAAAAAAEEDISSHSPLNFCAAVNSEH